MKMSNVAEIKRIDLKEQDNLEGRTARLLDYCYSRDYVETLRNMLCTYVGSSDFEEMNEVARAGVIFEVTLLIEYVAQLGKELY